MPVKFDVDAARTHGYSDTEIADAIASKANFDAVGARKAGYGDAEIIKQLTAPQATAQSAADAAQKEIADQQGPVQSVLIGAGRTFDRIGKGMQQGWDALTGDTKAAADLKSRAQDDDRMYKPLQNSHPITTAVGESLPAMAIPVGGAGGTLATMGRMAVSAAAPAALEYGTPEERAKRAALAGVGGVVGGVVVPKIVGMTVNAGKAALKGLAGNITPAALALAGKAKALGIPVNAAQLGDSKFLKTLASSLEQMPFTGAAADAAKQRGAFTNAVSKTFGADVEKITPEVYSAEKKRLGQQFDDLAARNELDVTPVMKTKLQGIADQAEATASDDTVRAVRNILGRATDQATANGKIPGATYSSIDTELSNIIKAGGEKGLYAQRMQSAIREAMDASIAPADQAAWSTARTQYKNLKAVRDIVAKNTTNGDIPPHQLMNALTNSEAGKEAMAMGVRGTLGDLGQVGKQFVRDQVPNSGTAQRIMAMGLIGGGGYAAGADPKTIAGMMLGGATAGRMINKIMQNPKVIESLSRQGITSAQLAKMPPNKITQILGGITGMSAAELLGV